MRIQEFVDADYAGDVVDRKYMSGYLIKLSNATRIWGSKKQASVTEACFLDNATVALSTCESE